MKIYLSSCSGDVRTELPGWREMARTSSEEVEFTSSPDLADFIIVIGFDDRDYFEALRRNPVWRRYPWKSFGIFEGDNAPRYLHGLYCGVPKKWNSTGRFSGLAYVWHQKVFPNPVPSLDSVRSCEKKYLFAYIGRNSNFLRRKILDACGNLLDVHIEDSSHIYNHFSKDGIARKERQEYYWSVMSRAKYCLCPAGAAPSSVRLFEIMQAGIAPVVIADQWVPPHGPEWDKFCLRVPENRVKDLHRMVHEIEHEFEERGRLARQAWEQWFAPERYWDFLIASIRTIKEKQMITEWAYTRLLPTFLLSDVLRGIIFKTKIQIKKCLSQK
jgi:hypothetical protein